MIAYLDCSTGVSGDKFLGALLDAGSDGAFTAVDLQSVVSAMVADADVVVDAIASGEMAAIAVRVESDDRQPRRTLSDITALIAAAGLTDSVARRAVKTFELLASAEARVHGCAPEDVHFHEVGAVDSIMDVVGTCLGLEALGIERLTASAVAVGGGTALAAHGVLAVPAPATCELLTGIPTVAGPGDDPALLGELTTPTGAALLRTCVDDFGLWPAMTPRITGAGAGTRDIGVPNVCRLVIGDPVEPIELSDEHVSVLETNVDHISGEAIAFAAEQLLREGALDVWTTPVLMKKGRPAYLLSALVETSSAEKFAERVVALTGTLGVRRADSSRWVAQRAVDELQTLYGPVRFKIGPAGARPEADGVARIATEGGRDFTSAAEELKELLTGPMRPDDRSDS